MKKRQLKMVFKIVAKQINSGDFTKLKPAHLRIVSNAFASFFDRKYLNEFRPWWYEQFDRWSELSFGQELQKFIQKYDKSVEEWSGINVKMYKQYCGLHYLRIGL
jgi:hypothetical protein